MIKTCIILPTGRFQQQLFWVNYSKLDPGYDHDIVLIHRNFLGLENFEPCNKKGKIIYENKIIDGKDLPHQAFGAYKYYYQKYKDNYDLFIFLSDDVIIKRHKWIKYIVDNLYKNDAIGFGGSQIFNGGKNYPHESHIRAPFWFAKKETLEKANWEFKSDHDGEMKIGFQLARTDYVGIQIGNKLDLGFDAFEKNHITQILENKYFSPTDNYFIYEEFDYFRNLHKNLSKRKINKENIFSPFKHIGKQNVFIDLEPYDNLIFIETLDVAKKYLEIDKIYKDTYVIS